MPNPLFKNKGFTVIEMLVYAAGITLVMGIIITMLYFTYSWYDRIVLSSRADSVAVNISNRLLGDIRNGISVDTVNSRFATTSSYITLNTQTGTTTTAIRYYGLQNGRVIFTENSGTLQYLSPVDVSITSFWLDNLDGTNSDAVRFSFDITYTLRAGTTTVTYSGFAILRNSYE